MALSMGLEGRHAAPVARITVGLDQRDGRTARAPSMPTWALRAGMRPRSLA